MPQKKRAPTRIHATTTAVTIATPAQADANNGNWRTAHRWQQLLVNDYDVIVQGDSSAKISPTTDILIALHARRSASIIHDFRAAYPDKPIIVVLTGTDLYRDLPDNLDAQQSLKNATVLIVLQEDAIAHIPLQHRHKTHIIFQSAKPLLPAKKQRDKLNCVVVGHLRDEKDPTTILNTFDHLSSDANIHILHIGAPLDPKLGAVSQSKMAEDARYHWVGGLPHGLTRAAIKRAHVLIHPSIMEGGANVIVEAIVSGTPVLASKMSGNVGMLGREYAGYFPVGDAKALADLITRCLHNPNFLLRLKTEATARAKLFFPEAERAALKRVINSLLD